MKEKQFPDSRRVETADNTLWCSRRSMQFSCLLAERTIHPKHNCPYLWSAIYWSLPLAHVTNWSFLRPTSKTYEMKKEEALSMGVALGVCFRTTIGAITGNIGLWLSLGIAIGGAFGGAFAVAAKKKEGEEWFLGAPCSGTSSLQDRAFCFIFALRTKDAALIPGAEIWITRCARDPYATTFCKAKSNVRWTFEWSTRVSGKHIFFSKATNCQ